MSKRSAKQFCKENLGKEVVVFKYPSEEFLVKGMIVGYVEKENDDEIILSFENSVEGWIREVADKSIKILIQSPLCKSYWIKSINADFKFVQIMEETKEQYEDEVLECSSTQTEEVIEEISLMNDIWY